MLRTLREKHLLWPGLAALAGLAVLISLGNWQMQRLAWKNHLIAAIAERAHAAPVSLAAADAAAARGEDIEYTRVEATGHLINDREIHYYALDATHGPGFYIITPLKLADGSVALVNRGFVPNDLKSPSRRPAGQITEEVHIVGLLRAPDKQGMFVPANEPGRNIWYWRDITAMGAAAAADEGARVHPFFIDAEAEPAPPGGWPKGGVTRLELPNRHFEYALTWYGLAGALVAVFAAFAVGRWRRLDTP
jgi:surfeit locus 1 family protein